MRRLKAEGFVGLSLILPLLLACDRDTVSDSAQVAVEDSAGVRLVIFPPPENWELPVELGEMLRIGQEDGPSELLFSVVAGGHIREDGSVVIVDRQSREVRQFDVEGTFISTHGRQGDGPGEYAYIRGIDACRPTGFTVFDIDWTMSHYDSGGAFVEEEPFRLEDHSSPYNLVCDRSGRVAVTNRDPNTWVQEGLYLAMSRLRILDAEGEEVAELGDHIGAERWFGEGTDVIPHPAGRSTRFGFMNGDLVVTDGSFFGFEKWNDQGDLMEIVRVDVEPPNIDSLADAYLNATLERAPDEETRRRWRGTVEAMEWPAQSAFFSDFLVREDGILAQEISFDGTGRWFLFSFDGQPRGYLPLPSGARLLDVRGNRILVEERTNLDVPQVVLYSMEPLEE